MPRPKRFHPPAGEPVVALGWRRSGGLLVVTRREGLLRVHGTLRGSTSGHVLTVPLVGAQKRLLIDKWYPCLALSHVRDGKELPLVMDPHTRTLHQLGGAAASLQPLLEGVSALFERRGGLFYVDRDPGMNGPTTPRTGCLLPKAFDGWVKTLPVEGTGAAYFGQVRDSSLKLPGPPLAIRSQPGQWWVTRDSHDEKQGAMVPIAEGLRVVGLCCWPVDTQTPGLVVLGKDLRTFYRVTADGASEFLVTAPDLVRSSCVSTALPLMAWLTVKGEVGGWSFQHRALVYRSTPGGKP